MSNANEAKPPARSAKQRGWRDRDHTRGSLFASLLVLALPLLASSVLGGVVFQLVDLTFLSRLGEAPMAAVIIVNQTLRQLLMLLLIGGSFGSQALIAQAVGEGGVIGGNHATFSQRGHVFLSVEAEYIHPAF